MSKKPIFCATHPRACSSAFERVFLTRSDLKVFHEPFGEPFYHSKERLGSRYDDDPEARKDTEHNNTTFKTILDEILEDDNENNRVFLKDMVYYLMPPDGSPPSIAPSLLAKKRGVGTEQNGSVERHPYPYGTEAEPGNPTVVPDELLKKFHWTFLIRHPRSSIPSYVRCTKPPQSQKTGWSNFMPNEAGYAELVRILDYLREKGYIGESGSKTISNGVNGASHEPPVEIFVLDADDMLDNPEPTVKAYCKSVGLEYKPEMLNWDNEEDQKRAEDQFEKWPGWHDDALESTCLKKREHKKTPKSDEELYQTWVERYGEESAKVIKKTVDENTPHYEYLKQFALKV